MYISNGNLLGRHPEIMPAKSRPTLRSFFRTLNSVVRDHQKKCRAEWEGRQVERNARHRQLTNTGMDMEKRFIDIMTDPETIDNLPPWISHFEAPEYSDDRQFSVDAWAVLPCGEKIPLQVKSTERAAERHAEKLRGYKVGLILVTPDHSREAIISTALKVTVQTALSRNFNHPEFPKEWVQEFALVA